jgi:hypothetical protein
MRVPLGLLTTDARVWRVAAAVLTSVALSVATPSLEARQSKDTLVVNVTGAEYHEREGTIVLKAAASNATTRDAIIEMAQLAHVSRSADGDVQLGYVQTGKLPSFAQFVVEAGKARVFEIVSEVDLNDFYNDGLEPTFLPEAARTQARAGRLVLELRAIDGAGQKHQNFFRIGTVGVFKEGGKSGRPDIILNGNSLNALESTDFFRQTAAILAGKH